MRRLTSINQRFPNYTRTELTDALHENAGFRTDTELTTPKAMAGIIRRSKGK